MDEPRNIPLLTTNPDGGDGTAEIVGYLFSLIHLSQGFSFPGKKYSYLCNR
jgi:hypothetical protein